ncbi:hypothetical protein JCM18899A_32800 [Nocardioides sp. AN3]
MPTGPRHRKSERGRGLIWVPAALGAALLAGGAAAPHLRHVNVPVETPSSVAKVVGGATPAPPSPEAAAWAARPTPQRVRRAENAGPPLRVDIATLGISAPVNPVALDAGVLEPPADFHRVGWWQGGAVAGSARGTALIAGHTVHTGGGVFNDLGRLRAGDHVSVTTTKGKLDYRVETVTLYSKASLSRHAQEVFSQVVPGRLALVTCEDWNGHGYNSNVVVLATAT